MQMNSRNLALLMCAAAAFVPSALKAQTVTISPGYTSIGVNQTLQYTATVTGLTNQTVTWSVSGVTGGNATNGKITQAGLYTAPAKIPANGVTIGALASDGKTLGVVYVNIAPPGPTITAISPSPIPTGSYSITLTGTGFQSGAIVQAVGANLSTTFVNATTLKAAGYQGPAGAVVFSAINPGSLWGPGFTATFVAAGPPPPQVISPTTVTLKFGATQQFTSSGATSWAATAGTITSGGLYTAPSTLPSSGTATVTATGPGGSAKAVVTVTNPNPQVIAPTSVTLGLGATQQFTSTGATSWKAVSGTITTAGLYTAPAALPASSADTVTVTGANGTATATVTLIPPTPVITSVGSGQLPLGIFSATITGTGFLASSVAQLNGTALGTTYSGGALNVTGFYGQSGVANITVSNGSVVSQPFPVQIGIANAQVSAAAARRFLEQARIRPDPDGCGDRADASAFRPG